MALMTLDVLTEECGSLRKVTVCAMEVVEHARVATITHFGVFLVELTVTSIENKHIWIEKMGIAHLVLVSVKLAEDAGKLWAAVVRKLTVEDNNSICEGFIEESINEDLRVIDIGSTLNVATGVFVIISAVDNEEIFKELIIFSCQKVHESITGDTRDATRERESRKEIGILW